MQGLELDTVKGSFALWAVVRLIRSASIADLFALEPMPVFLMAPHVSATCASILAKLCSKVLDRQERSEMLRSLFGGGEVTAL